MTVSEKWLDGIVLRNLVRITKEVADEDGFHTTITMGTLLASIETLRKVARESALEEGFTISK